MLAQINVKKVDEKLSFWEAESKKLYKNLPEDDKVWMSWRSILQSFMMTMKWIEKLVDEIFKVQIIYIK